MEKLGFYESNAKGQLEEHIKCQRNELFDMDDTYLWKNRLSMLLIFSSCIRHVASISHDSPQNWASFCSYLIHD